MNNDISGDGAILATSPRNDVSIHASRLITRGLSDIATMQASQNAVDIARNGKREFRGLSDRAVMIALEKPEYWGYSLLFHVIRREIEGYESVRQAIDSGDYPGFEETVEHTDCLIWLQTRTEEVVLLVQSLQQLYFQGMSQISDLMDKEDPEEIIKIGRRFGLIYKQLLDISVRCLLLRRDPLFDNVIVAFMESVIAVTSSATVCL